MKKISIGIALLTLAVLLVPSKLSAKTLNMVFLYPGEAGSTEEAKPVLELFFNAIDERISPLDVSGDYFNDLSKGAKYIKTNRPTIGIVSYSSYIQNPELFNGASVVLSVLPFPEKKTTETYKLIGLTKKHTGEITIYSSEPLSKSFINSHLFKNLTNFETEQTSQMFLMLNKIASGEKNAVAILTPMEAFTFDKLSIPWVKKLRVLENSEKVPTARVVSFNDTDKTKIDKIINALLSLNQSEEGKAILLELRLSGFKEIK